MFVFETDGTVLVQIRRTGDLSSSATIRYGITADTAKESKDYVGRSDSVTMGAGISQITVPVDILNDNTAEDTETFTFSIVSVENRTLLVPRATLVNIFDDERIVQREAVPPLVSQYDVIERPVYLASALR